MDTKAVMALYPGLPEGKPLLTNTIPDKRITTCQGAGGYFGYQKLTGTAKEHTMQPQLRPPTQADCTAV